MIEIRVASADEVEMAFLRAEVDSARWGRMYSGAIARSGESRESLVDNGDLGNSRQNDIRRDVLGQLRGYGRNVLLFKGFPQDVSWCLIRLGPGDFSTMKYAANPPWPAMTNGTRSVTAFASTVSSGTAPEDSANHIRAVAELLKGGTLFPEMILVRGTDGLPIIVEGHVRATAYVVAGRTENIEAFVGASPYIGRWAYH